MAFSGGSAAVAMAGQAPSPFSPFGRSPSPNPTANPFASAPKPAANPFGGPFGAPSQPQASVPFSTPFGQAAQTTNNTLSTPSPFHSSPFQQAQQAKPSPFGAPSQTITPNTGSGGGSAGFGMNGLAGFGSSGSQAQNANASPFSKPSPFASASIPAQSSPFGNRSVSPFSQPTTSQNSFPKTSSPASNSPFGKPSAPNASQSTFSGATIFGGGPFGSSSSDGTVAFSNGKRGGPNGNSAQKNRKPNFSETLEAKGKFVAATGNGGYQLTRSQPRNMPPISRHDDPHHNPFKALSEKQADPATARKHKGKVIKFTAAAPVATLEEFSTAVNNQLRKDRVKDMILPPDFFEPSKKPKAQAFRESHLDNHKNQVRSSLEKGHLIDVYEKQINIEDAIDFRGTCDEMCPLYEVIIRVAEGISQMEEREEGPDGIPWPARHKFIKRHARSSAGDKPPLPSEVRTLSALERTTNYLLDDILQGEHNLRDRHAFLWDRLRAVRRDFIFYTRMTTEETLVMVDILETIARFHAVSHHLLAKKDAANTDYSPKQEQEALQKTLISLKQAYMDLNKQGIHCKNEPEFMAYWILFFADDPSTIRRLDNEMLQRNWSTSNQVQTAISLVQARLDFRTPLQKGQKTPRQKPYEYFPSLAIGEAAVYFDIVADPTVSYTMACIAEMSFTMIRDRLLNTIIQACSRSRDSPKDITPAGLREVLRFDTEDEAVEFVEGRGINFSAEGNFLILNDKNQKVIESTVPTFSQSLVERKRGNRQLLQVIRNNVFEDEAPADAVDVMSPDSSAGMFVEDFPTTRQTEAKPKSPFGTSFPPAPSVFAPSTTSQKANGASSPFWAKPATPQPSVPAPPQGNTAKAPSTTVSLPKANPFGCHNYGQSGPSGLQSATPAVSTTTTSTSMFPPRPSFSSGNPFADASNPNFKITPPTPSSSADSSINKLSPPVFGSTTPTVQAPPTSILGQASTTPTPKSSLFGSTPGQMPLPQTAVSATTLTTAAPSAVSISSGPTTPSLSTSAPQPTVPQPEVKPIAGIQDRIASLAQKNGFMNGLTQSPTPSIPEIAPAPKPLAQALQALPQPQPMQPAPPPVPLVKKTDPLEALVKWYVLGDGGLLEEFRDSYVAHLVGEAFQRFHWEEEERKRREEDEKSWEEALKWRSYNLGLKYFYRWRDTARNRALSRRAKEGREAMKAYREAQMAEKKAEREAAEKKRRKEERLRASHRESVASTFVEDLRAMQQARNSRRGSSTYSMGDQMLVDTGVFDTLEGHRRTVSDTYREDFRDDDSVAEALLGPRSPRATPTPSPAPEKGKSNILRSWKDSLNRSANRVRESAMSVFSSSARDTAQRDSIDFDTETRSTPALSRTSSFSRSLPPKNRITNFSSVAKKRTASPGGSDTLNQFKRPRSVGLKTTHFRLRAMGMVHMPNGQYLPESIARPVLDGQGSAADEVDRDRQQDKAPVVESWRSRASTSSLRRVSAASLTRSVASPPQLHKRKRSTDGEAVEGGEDAMSVVSVDASSPQSGGGSKKQRTLDMEETERIIREMRETAALMQEGELWYREQSAAMERGNSPWVG